MRFAKFKRLSDKIWNRLVEFDSYLVSSIGYLGAGLAGCLVGTVLGFGFWKTVIHLIKSMQHL